LHFGAGVAELADARDSKSRPPAEEKSTQPIAPQATYDDSHETQKEQLGALLGAFAVKIAPLSPDLAALLTAWPALPDPLKAAVAAMVEATSGKGKGA
jgi:hypothetical protein